MNLLSIFSDVGEEDSLYIVIAIIVIFLFWGITKLCNRNN